MEPHPKDFDPEQVKPVLNNLAIIIRWYLKYKDFKIVSKVGSEKKEQKFIEQPEPRKEKTAIRPEKKKFFNTFRKVLLAILVIFLILMFVPQIAFRTTHKGTFNVPTIQIDPGAVTFTDPVNEEVYSEVKMGSQIWMGENLRSIRFSNGYSIPYIKDQLKWSGTVGPAYCWYDNDKKNFGTSGYGALYNWDAASSGKLCPVGWHVPSAAEWDTLALFLDPDATLSESGYHYSKVAGMKLKADGNLFWMITDTVYGTNYNNFRALPGGYRSDAGFFDMGTGGAWWSTTEEENTPEWAYERNIREALNSTFDRGPDPKNAGFSVRCIKDKAN